MDLEQEPCNILDALAKRASSFYESKYDSNIAYSITGYAKQIRHYLLRSKL